MVKIGKTALGNFPLLLAPMEDVSDPPFRQLCKDYGADLVFTEFISSGGLIRNAAKSVKKLDLFEQERPAGIQIFGGEIEPMKRAVEIAERVAPDMIDINYGCPVKKITCNGAGAGILQDIPKMVRMTKEIVRSTHLPVTVKTRLGWDENTQYICEVTEQLQDVGIQAISIHGRTRKQMYKGESDWTLIGRIKENSRICIPVFGNGDVKSPQKALEMKNRYGVDGIMIGRGAIGSPWIFRNIKHYFEEGELLSAPGIEEKVEICRSHLIRSREWKGEKTTIFEMRKHYHNYFKGLPHFKPFRLKLVQEKSFERLLELLEEIREFYAPEVAKM